MTMEKKKKMAAKPEGKEKEAYAMSQRGNNMNAMYNAVQGENASKLKKQMKKH